MVPQEMKARLSIRIIFFTLLPKRLFSGSFSSAVILGMFTWQHMEVKNTDTALAKPETSLGNMLYSKPPLTSWLIPLKISF